MSVSVVIATTKRLCETKLSGGAECLSHHVQQRRLSSMQPLTQPSTLSERLVAGAASVLHRSTSSRPHLLALALRVYRRPQHASRRGALSTLVGIHSCERWQNHLAGFVDS